MGLLEPVHGTGFEEVPVVQDVGSGKINIYYKEERHKVNVELQKSIYLRL